MQLQLSYSDLDAPHVVRSLYIVFFLLHYLFYFWNTCFKIVASPFHWLAVQLASLLNKQNSIRCIRFVFQAFKYSIKKPHVTKSVTKQLFGCFIFLLLHLYRPRTGFDKSSLERLELLFRKTVGNEKEIRREDFKKIVTSKNVSKLTKCKLKWLFLCIFKWE